MKALYKYHGPAKKNPRILYVPSHTDKLWLGRAFVGEHGRKSKNGKWRAHPEHVRGFVWCMLNRFLLHPGNRHWPTFLYMLRRFSQPVNPRWMRGGDLARKYKNSRMCTESRFARREEISALDWLDIPRLVRFELDRFMRGALPRPTEAAQYDEPPERWSNFAAATADLQRRHPAGFNLGGNWYFEDRRLRRGAVVIDLWE